MVNSPSNKKKYQPVMHSRLIDSSSTMYSTFTTKCFHFLIPPCAAFVCMLRCWIERKCVSIKNWLQSHTQVVLLLHDGTQRVGSRVHCKETKKSLQKANDSQQWGTRLAVCNQESTLQSTLFEKHKFKKFENFSKYDFTCTDVV